MSGGKRLSDLLELREEVVDHMFDLRRFGREQNQLLVGQVELQHVLRRDRHKQDVRVAAQGVKGQEVRLTSKQVRILLKWSKFYISLLRTASNISVVRRRKTPMQ